MVEVDKSYTHAKSQRGDEEVKKKINNRGSLHM